MMHSARNTVDINYKTFIIHVPTGMLQLNMTELNRCDRTILSGQLRIVEEKVKKGYIGLKLAVLNPNVTSNDNICLLFIVLLAL